MEGFVWQEAVLDLGGGEKQACGAEVRFLSRRGPAPLPNPPIQVAPGQQAAADRRSEAEVVKEATSAVVLGMYGWKRGVSYIMRVFTWGKRWGRWVCGAVRRRRCFNRSSSA